MRIINISVVALILNSFSLAQNWFPLEVGNKSLGRYEYSSGGQYCNFFLIHIQKDTLIDSLRYFYVVNKNYMTNSLHENLWLRYDSTAQKIYLRVLDTSVVYMDFNITDGQQFVYYNPITGFPIYRTVFEYTRSLFGYTKDSKGFVASSLSSQMREWIDGFGVKPSGNIIQILQIDNPDTVYYDYGYGPDYSYFDPVLEASSFNFNFDFSLGHHYTHAYYPLPIDFIDSIYFDCYYKSETDSISAPRLFSVNLQYFQRRVVFNLNPALIRNGYSFYYKVTAKDKGLIPKYKSKPDSGYYKLIYDPSPIQILFSEDSIYVPTLSDSGSVKIINTSDHSVRIDSIVSVGSFYGYWGNFTKPGFEYPFYLFQTMPGFMGDTLGIIIPPHDSINVSFYDIDLCPICDYEVQDYFEDTLRFVFTFMDGNVYSFSKSIPISGEGHPSDVEDEEMLPKEFSLSQNYPNPFNPSTKISWQSPVSSWQTIKVYDILGNEIATLVDEYRSAGNYNVEFRMQNVELSSGVYYYQLRAGDYLETKKMVLLK